MPSQLLQSKQASRANRRRLELHPACAPHQVELELDELLRSVRVGLGAHADVTVAQPPLQRTHPLPLEPVDRIPGRVRLRDCVAGELDSETIVVALRARKIQL